MQRIGIIGAMAQEVAQLASQLEDRETRSHAGSTFHTGRLHGMNVVLLQSGIGKVNAAVGTTQLLEQYAPEAVINTGSAGGFGEGLSIGDIVISREVRHHDVDAMVFGYEAGQVPGMPAAYLPDARLVAVARESIEAMGEVNVTEGLIATGDVFMACPDLVARTRARFPAMLAARDGSRCHRPNLPPLPVPLRRDSRAVGHCWTRRQSPVVRGVPDPGSRSLKPDGVAHDSTSICSLTAPPGTGGGHFVTCFFRRRTHTGQGVSKKGPDRNQALIYLTLTS